MGLINDQAQAPQSPVEPIAGGQEQAPVSGDNQATPQEQAALEGAINAAAHLLYKDEGSHEAIMGILQSSGEEPQAGVIEAVKMVVMEVDNQLDMPELIIAEFTAQVTDMVMELGEKAGVFQMSEQQQVDTLALVTIAILEEYGAEPGDLQEVLSSMSGGEQQELEQASQILGGV